MKQAKNNGVRNVAKPLTLLSIVDCIENGIAKNNMLYFDIIEEGYYHLKEQMGLTFNTKVQYPFYFLQSDGFYHIKWKNKPILTKSPSAKMLRGNVDFAYLDNALWDLLQDAEIRHQYKTLIIENFFSNKENK
ncbi:MAG: hypothetical protein K5874_00475 [Bacteroidaceae bacterium]|nr:hypothetical protein [Bacteroidaceae bacterium]